MRRIVLLCALAGLIGGAGCPMPDIDWDRPFRYASHDDPYDGDPNVDATADEPFNEAFVPFVFDPGWSDGQSYEAPEPSDGGSDTSDGNANSGTPDNSDDQSADDEGDDDQDDGYEESEDDGYYYDEWYWYTDEEGWAKP